MKIEGRSSGIGCAVAPFCGQTYGGFTHTPSKSYRILVFEMRNTFDA